MPDVVPPEAQTQAEYVRISTGMSQRALASLLGTTHPTIGALLSGQSTEFLRKPEVRRRLSDVFALCTRLSPLTSDDAKETGRLLEASDEEGRTVGYLAANGELSKAYLLALRTISPPSTAKMLNSPYPAQPGTATYALQD